MSCTSQSITEKCSLPHMAAPPLAFFPKDRGVSASWSTEGQGEALQLVAVVPF